MSTSPPTLPEVECPLIVGLLFFWHSLIVGLPSLVRYKCNFLRVAKNYIPTPIDIIKFMSTFKQIWLVADGGGTCPPTQTPRTDYEYEHWTFIILYANKHKLISLLNFAKLGKFHALLQHDLSVGLHVSVIRCWCDHLQLTCFLWLLADFKLEFLEMLSCISLASWFEYWMKRILSFVVWCYLPNNWWRGSCGEAKVRRL
jgi:hypothetical protein